MEGSRAYTTVVVPALKTAIMSVYTAATVGEVGKIK